MEAYRHFKLSLPPFEGKPDPAFFCELPAHAETLATLEYAAHAGKTCSVVLGESGSGKTLLGRMLARKVNRRAHVLWVHGIGQPEDNTELIVYPPGAAGNDSPRGLVRLKRSTLAAWLRGEGPTSANTLLIVDNADGLGPQGWRDLLTLVTREARGTKPISLVLLGLPSLVDQLAAPELARLRRRVFRTCVLDGLTREDTERYITHRIFVAGGDGQPFTGAALDAIHRLTGGNPALINAVCDNALIDALGDDRASIDAEHVMATARAIAGPLDRKYKPGNVTISLDTAAAALLHGEIFVEPVLRQLPASAVQPEEPDDAECTQQLAHEASAMPLAAPSAFERLQAVEGRLTAALSWLRETRAQRRPATSTPTADDLSVDTVDTEAELLGAADDATAP